MGDIDYFSEAEMDGSNLKDFYNSLPWHLQNNLNSSWGDFDNKFNVLQEYKGPDNLRDYSSGDSSTLNPSYGVQEIKFRWGLTKKVFGAAAIPVIGLVLGAIKIGQTIQKNSVYSLYFDEITGDILEKNTAINQRKNNERAEELSTTAKDLYNQGNYASAAKKFAEAHDKCSTHYKNKSSFLSQKNQALNLHADYLNEQGNTVWYAGEYLQAKNLYQQAYQTCSDDYSNKNRFRNNINEAQSELDAADLKAQGDTEFNADRYDSAKNFYQQAYNRSQVETEKNKYKADINKAGALALNKEGVSLYEEGNSLNGEAAINKYQEAITKLIQASSIQVDLEQQVSNTIFDSLKGVITKLIESNAYQEAQDTINSSTIHFSNRDEEFQELRQMIAGAREQTDNERSSEDDSEESVASLIAGNLEDHWSGDQGSVLSGNTSSDDSGY